MQTFKDAAGRTWAVAINCWTIKQAKAYSGIHVPSLVDEGFAGYRRLLADGAMLADVIYGLCREEADAKRIDEAGFLREMHGDALDAATAAFRAEFVDFFRNPDQRAAVREVMETLDRVMREMVEQGRKELGTIDLSTAAGSNGIATGSPESSASTPAPSPSAS